MCIVSINISHWNLNYLDLSNFIFCIHLLQNCIFRVFYAEKTSNHCHSSLGGASRHLARVPVKTMARFARKKVGGKNLLEGKLKSGSEEIEKFLSMGREGHASKGKGWLQSKFDICMTRKTRKNLKFDQEMARKTENITRKSFLKWLRALIVILSIR